MIDTMEEEAYVIGSICQDSSLIRTISSIVEPKHFQYDSYRTVYEYALEAESNGKVFDALIAADALGGKIDGIRKFIAECIEVVPTTANAEEYARLLRSKSEERELRSGVEIALSEERGEWLIDRISSMCNKIIQNRLGNRMKRLDEVMEKTYLGLFEEPKNRVDTGYGRLDYLLKGMWGGELIIIAARPAVGKSAFALSIAENVARAGKAVHFYSLEMEGVEIGERELSRWTKTLTMDGIIDKNITDEILSDDAADAYRKTAPLPVYIDDSPNVSPAKVRLQAFSQKNLGLIIVDYGGLMKSDRKHEKRYLEIGAISRDLKNIAKELQVPVIMLNQLNRGVDETEKPSLRELRDSGELEQNANKCIFLWNIDKEEGKVGVSVAKNRKGKRGEVVMFFDGNHMRFSELEERYEEIPRRRKYGGGFSNDDD